MKSPIFSIFSMPALIAIAGLAGCSTTAKAPDVSDSIRKALDRPALKDVSVSDDREKGVVTVGGHVATESDKEQAEAIARQMAAGQVLSDQIAVIPPADASEAKTVASDLDSAIGKNLDAALIQSGLHDAVKYDVKNLVVTLSGDVNSESQRGNAQQIAAAVPNVRQVVNELQVKNQRATSQP